jgi:VCBS repeat-containing protein
VFLALTLPLGAAVITVNSSADSLAGAQCTLRMAIINANDDAATYSQCVAGSGADTINFTSAFTITLTIARANQDDDANSGDLNITQSVTIEGGGTTIDGNASDRVFHVTGGTATLRNLWIRNGRGVEGGGGVWVDGATATLQNVTISGCVASAEDGGGIKVINAGVLNLTNCTIDGNSTVVHGGGIAIDDSQAVATIVGSTITSNHGGFSNTTGGIHNTGTCSLRNTIVAGNSGTDIPNLDGTFTSNGYNIIGTLGTLVGNPQITATTGDQFDVNFADLQLGPLQNNGGPVPTRELQSGSIAIDQGHSSGSTTDARGLTRPCDQAGITNATGGDGADVGAFEVQGTCVAPNTPPVATADSYSGNQDTVLSVAAPGVLGNDTDADNDTLTANLVSGPSHGSLTLNADGSFSYTPAAHFAGSDSFTYRAYDGTAYSNTVAVSITIIDTEPPAISASLGTSVLWPPQHDLLNVGFTFTTSDNSPGTITTSVAVFSNEDDVTTANGDESPDAKDIASGTLRLRAERDANGNGRVYLIEVTATDAFANTSHQCVAAVVPKSLSAGDLGAVNAMASAAVGVCNSTGHPPAGYFVVGDGPVIGPKQ